MNAGTATPRASAKARGRATIRKHSKSFRLASTLLGDHLGGDALALYAYCRRADDAIDLAQASEAATQVAQLEAELDAVYAGRSLAEPTLEEFQRVVFERAIPREYPAALLRGFAFDAAGVRVQTLAELDDYAWCVAGSVGAMMCHVLGVRRPRALVHGAHLGMAMQLTNICRDVAEDYALGRLYVPGELLAQQGAPSLEPAPGRALPEPALEPLFFVVQALLARAELFYASGDEGVRYLSPRGAFAVSTARHVYAAIGRHVHSAGAAGLRQRSYVPAHEKLLLLARAFAATLRSRAGAPSGPSCVALGVLKYPEDLVGRFPPS